MLASQEPCCRDDWPELARPVTHTVSHACLPPACNASDISLLVDLLRICV